jgi:uncharacterized protein
MDVGSGFPCSIQKNAREPRQEEDPHARVEDIRAAVDYLTTLGFVDQQRICVLGICSGGGYAINAAMTDRRIKAVGTVSAINLGALYRAGYEGTVADMSQAFTLLEMAAKARTAEAKGERMATLPFAPQKREEGQAPDYREAWEYYHTPRAQHPNAPSVVPVHSLARLVPYDAFHLAEQLLTQPLRLIAGGRAGSLWFSQDAFRRAGSRDKSLHIVEGATHIAMYDTPEFVRAALPKRKQGFVGEQLRRAAERACCNGCRGISSVNSLGAMQFSRRQCRSALPFFPGCPAINGMLDDQQAPSADSSTQVSAVNSTGTGSRRF